MAGSSRYQRIIVIVLSALCILSAQCMESKALLGEKSAVDRGKGAVTAVSLDDVFIHPKGQGFRRYQSMDKPTTSAGDIQQYLYSNRQITKPAPGLSKTHLNHMVGNVKHGAQGSSYGGSADQPYWPAMHINSLAEDFEKMSEELDKFARDMRERKYSPGYYSGTVTGQREAIDKPKLDENVKDLEAVRDSLKSYIEYWLVNWAAENHISKNKIFVAKRIPQGRTGAQEPLDLEPGTIMTLFPEDRLDNVSKSLRGRFNNLDDNDRDFATLHRIYIQLIDQAYKHGVIGISAFHKSMTARDFASVAGRNMFLHFSRSAKEYKNPLFKNGDILLELWYASPFVNMMNVFLPKEKARFLYQIIKSDALEYILTKPAGLAEDNLEVAFKALFKSDLLLTVLEDKTLWNEYNALQADIYLQKILTIFRDNRSWLKDPGNNEAIRIMGQILKFVDEYNMEPETKFEKLRRAMFKDSSIRNKVNLLSSRAHAVVELEKISNYLREDFPLKNDSIFPKPISTLEEIDLIARQLDHLPAQERYRQVIKVQQEPYKTNFEAEIKAKMDALWTQIDEVHKKCSKPSKSEGPGFLQRIFKGKGKGKLKEIAYHS
ncbi:hypothetical protein Pst134EB_014333 [Puccinia striiformis f. sp. tritici]|nr:hypothetical protein Pst134EB_014333 [Puccinia striiformis f. sp. tritici]